MSLGYEGDWVSYLADPGQAKGSMCAHTFVSMSGLGGMEARRDFYVEEANLKSVYRQI